MPTNNFSCCNEEGSNQLRRGPWTYEEDSLLTHYINSHGEGRWNILANCAGLMRTGKSCRLRWLNYLKPDIKRGNLTPQEQLLILELHSKWGNRWSKIAAHLPGRTDNEIKNYWRTRVQKQARQLKVDSNSKKFLEALRRLWMPRLLEKMEQTSSQSHASSSFSSSSTIKTQDSETPFTVTNSAPMALTKSTDSMIKSEGPEISDDKNPPINDCYHVDISSFDMESFDQQEMSIIGADEISISDCQMAEIDWTSLDAGSNFWDMDELWEFRK